MCVYIFICIYTICKCVNVYMYIYIYTYILHVHLYVYIHTYVRFNKKVNLIQHEISLKNVSRRKHLEILQIFFGGKSSRNRDLEASELGSV